MWFKNLQLYRLPTPWPVDLAKFEEQLARGPFVKCPSNQPMSRGWVSPRRDGALVFSLNKQWLIALAVERQGFVAGGAEADVARGLGHIGFDLGLALAGQRNGDRSGLSGSGDGENGHGGQSKSTDHNH